MSGQNIIVSHKEDIDGIVSAALIKNFLLQNGLEPGRIETYLVDYPNYAKLLRKVACGNLSMIYIADLGLNEQIVNIIMEIPEEYFQNERLTIRYFDHHKIPGCLDNIGVQINQRIDYHNPIDKKDFCTAELIFDKLFHNTDYHFQLLSQYAHCSDFLCQWEGVNESIVESLRMYIVYYQERMDMLIQLMDAMLLPETWEQYQLTIKTESSNIAAWHQEQYDKILDSYLSYEYESLRFALSTAQCKPEEITDYLIKHISGHDLYIGISTRTYYVNIKSNIEISHKLAELYGGGGHSRRAGFKFPDKYLCNINSQRDFKKQLLEFLKEIAKNYKKLSDIFLISP